MTFFSNYKCLCGASFEQKGQLSKHRFVCKQYRELVTKVAKDPETLALIRKLGSLKAAARELGVSPSSLDNAMRREGTHPYGKTCYGKKAKTVGDLLSSLNIGAIKDDKVAMHLPLDVTPEQILNAIGYMIGELKLLREKVIELEEKNLGLVEQLTNANKTLQKTYSLQIENINTQQAMDSKGLSKR